VANSDSGVTAPEVVVQRNGNGRARWVVHVLLVVVTLALVIGAFVFWEARRGRPTPVQAAGTPQAVPVSVVEVRPQDVALAPSYLGRTEASQKVEIRARVNGFLDAVTFQEGGNVEAGQPLFQIDPRPFQVRLNEAKAAQASAEARLAQARRQLERAQAAAQGGAVSQIEIDQWLTEERVALAELSLEQARVATAELDMSYTAVASPIAGVIGETELDVGSYVQAGAEGLLAEVQQIDPIHLHFSVSESELREWEEMVASGEVRVPPEGELRFRVQLVDGSLYPQEGRLEFVGRSLAPTTGTAMVRGELPNPEGTLRPGQFVRVIAQGIVRVGAITVPQRAVMQGAGGGSVYVVDAEGKAQVRSVVLGDWVGDSWVVRRGLQAGERVVVDNLVKVRPGTPVAATVVQSEALPGTGVTATIGSPR
jgi:membrane fusion protein (multidrug efflux system)